MSCRVLTNVKGPANSMPLPGRKTTLTSGFLPGSMENSILSKCRIRNVAGPMRRRSTGVIEHETSVVGFWPGLVGACTSTARLRVAAPIGLWAAVASTGDRMESLDRCPTATGGCRWTSRGGR